MRGTPAKAIRAVIAAGLGLWLVAYAAFPRPVYAAGITPNPLSGPPGTTVTVTGSGFGDNETSISLAFDGSSVSSGIAATSQGTWSASFTVPPSSSGSHTLSAAGPSTAAITATFTVTPALSISPASGVPGSSVTVSGAGFAAGETGIAVTYDGASVASGITASAQGSWSKTFIAPASPAGAHVIDASGAATSAAAVPDATFNTAAGVSVNPASGAPGISVAVAGSGFAANESGITVTYDGATVASGIKANSQGGWNGTFVVPASPSGPHAIRASGSSTSASSISDVTFSSTAGISANPVVAVPGRLVTVIGSGFAANEVGIAITYDGTSIASNIKANSQGSWTGTFVVPASPSGSHTLDAGGPSTAASTIGDIDFKVVAGVSISRTGGAPGNSINVVGSGFGANESGISVTYDTSTVASGINATAQGDWKTTFTVPESVSGSHTIGASGSVTRADAVIGATFNIGSGVSVSPTLGYIGQTVEIAGSGFAPNSAIKFSFDDKEIQMEQGITSDDSGSFSGSIVIPKSRHGTHTLTVSDRSGNKSKIDFTVESVPPAVPRPLSPGDGATVGLLGGTRPTFKWSNVTDPSGVTFSLQIDTNPAFPQPVFEKTGIVGSQFTLSAADSLPKGQYYWRVMAVDGASNESSWSEPQLLKSGAMDLWVLVVIVVAVAAAIGAGAYFILARLAHRRRELAPVPEVQLPQVFPTRLRLIEPEAASRGSPARLALPQPVKRGKTMSAEDMARVKVIIDFAQSLPLVEPGYTANWLVDLVQSSTGIEAPDAIHERLLKGELHVRYEPTWMRHPTYLDLTTLLHGQPFLQELSSFIESVDRCASEAAFLLQDIYRDSIAEAPSDFLPRGGWGYVAAVYSDALSWYLGKSLRDPSPRDYTIARDGAASREAEKMWLCGGENTSFAGPLIQVLDDNEAAQAQTLHLKLRRTYRSSDPAKRIVSMMTQIGLQRERLGNALSQLGR